MSVQFIFPLHDFSGVFFGAMVKPTWEINLVCFSDSALQCNCDRSAKIVRINITIHLLRKECFFFSPLYTQNYALFHLNSCCLFYKTSNFLWLPILPKSFVYFLYFLIHVDCIFWYKDLKLVGNWQNQQDWVTVLLSEEISMDEILNHVESSRKSSIVISGASHSL